MEKIQVDRIMMMTLITLRTVTFSKAIGAHSGL